jgi:hypothetical protein
MRGTIKLDKTIFRKDFADVVLDDGQKINQYIDFESLGETLTQFKRVEFSTKPFSGATKIPLKAHVIKGAKAAIYKGQANYICADWVKKLGLTKQNYIYVKVRR